MSFLVRFLCVFGRLGHLQFRDFFSSVVESLSRRFGIVMLMLTNWIWIALGAILGAWARHGASLWVQSKGWSQPWATLGVNLMGALIIGLALGAQLTRAWMSEEARFFLVTGFLGALTTFSTYSWETLRLYHDQGMGIAALYVLASNLGCFGLVWMGWKKFAL